MLYAEWNQIPLEDHLLVYSFVFCPLSTRLAHFISMPKAFGTGRQRGSLRATEKARHKAWVTVCNSGKVYLLTTHMY